MISIRHDIGALLIQQGIRYIKTECVIAKNNKKTSIWWIINKASQIAWLRIYYY